MLFSEQASSWLQSVSRLFLVRIGSGSGMSISSSGISSGVSVVVIIAWLV